MTIRDDIVTAARSYLNTPFHHQGRAKGVGVDCIGLAICVARDCGLIDPDFNVTGYARLPNSRDLLSGLDQQMQHIEIKDRQPGDLLLMRFREEPQHVAFLTDLGILHAYAEVGRVTEHSYDELWISRTLGAYRFKGVV